MTWAGFERRYHSIQPAEMAMPIPAARITTRIRKSRLTRTCVSIKHFQSDQMGKEDQNKTEIACMTVSTPMSFIPSGVRSCFMFSLGRTSV